MNLTNKMVNISSKTDKLSTLKSRISGRHKTAWLHFVRSITQRRVRILAKIIGPRESQVRVKKTVAWTFYPSFLLSYRFQWLEWQYQAQRSAPKVIDKGNTLWECTGRTGIPLENRGDPPLLRDSDTISPLFPLMRRLEPPNLVNIPSVGPVRPSQFHLLWLQKSTP